MFNLRKLFSRNKDNGLDFPYFDPPFNFNSPGVSAFPAEVTGYYLIRSMCKRIGWPSVSNKRLLDFGCGIRFTKTIVNLDLDIANYTGVDVNAQLIDWLHKNLDDPRFKFIRLDMANKLYNLSGKEIEDYSALEQMGLVGFDAACMFSVITHQDPSDAEAIFKMLHRSVNDGGSLYFTAFTSDAVEGYAEAVPGQLNLQSYYHPTVIKDLLVKTGWTLVEIYPEEPLQQTAFVCRK